MTLGDYTETDILRGFFDAFAAPAAIGRHARFMA